MHNTQTAPRPEQWQVWAGAGYYQNELRQRALGLLPEMESAKQIAHLVRQIHQPQNSILDAGCGAGHYLLSLERLLPGPFPYAGLDITPEHIEDAEKIFANRPNTTFQVGDVRRLPFDDAQFDITICANTLPHIPNAAQALSEMMRVTRKALFVRMMVGKEILITKKAYSDELDEQGEPVHFCYGNIYTESFVRGALGPDCRQIDLFENEFDQEQLSLHFQRHGQVAGSQRATQVIQGHQVKGYLILPWKVVRALK